MFLVKFFSTFTHLFTWLINLTATSPQVILPPKIITRMGFEEFENKEQIGEKECVQFLSIARTSFTLSEVIGQGGEAPNEHVKFPSRRSAVGWEGSVNARTRKLRRNPPYLYKKSNYESKMRCLILENIIGEDMRGIQKRKNLMRQDKDAEG
jgi:hypothetical protein